MSQYGSMAPPGSYLPPTQGAPAQQQSSQQPSPYQPGAPNYGAAGQAPKNGGTFGQMMNQRLEQAVTTGKPMLNKLGKTISSKLGNKPAGGPPQHLQSYQNYQNHQGQQPQSPVYQHQPGPSYSPQPQPQPPQQQQHWGQPQQQPPPQAPNASYGSPQQSPYPQSNYATPPSGHSGQGNYFPQQNQAPSSQSYAPQQPLTTSGYTMTPYGQGGSTTEQTQTQQGPFGQSQVIQAQHQAPYQQEPQLQSQYTGQQTGVVASAQGGPSMQSTQIPNFTSDMAAQPVQSQWGVLSSEQVPLPAHQQQSSMPMASPQPYHAAPTPPAQQDQYLHQQQQWNAVSPASPQGQEQNQMQPHAVSPPPLQQTTAVPQVPSNEAAQPTQPPTPVPQPAAPNAAPAEFLAELPADMGNLSLMEAKPLGPDLPPPGSQYQAYRPPGSQKGSPSPSFTIPRRSLSASTFPLADPWRFADPATETPTREFYILADLIFDALDRKFEPKNTGLLEAPKIIGSWIKLQEDGRRLYTYRSYSAFAKLWSLEGIPHIMVPCDSALTPNWNFNQHSHAQDVKVIAEPPTAMTMSPTYMPALNRAGWYKFFFLEMMHAPEDIGDLIPALCANTYKPGVLNHPDLTKRDSSEPPALMARAAEIQTYAIGRACSDISAAMAVDPDVPLAHTHPAAPAPPSSQPGGEMAPTDMMVRMHGIQMQQQFNNMAAWTMLGAPPRGYSGGCASIV
ncbi:hypothetical protein BDW02DRAFT_325033 [Decorospora gaudefroyi]|uniref:PAT1 multi-domain protein n=1 Tax=Decorospora gaudefroyi TaxID=184978 RepID=A0A6A5KH00_9PLEO|nr:hypothetical protein BDW02DRAFT_325033 [Decorospora gaudefroyi]